MKVDVYYNLNKKCLSVRSREKENYGKVFKHLNSVILKNCSFVVSERGRQRVLRDKRKNVHAVVRGELLGEYERIFLKLDDMVPVTYNPYRYQTFIKIEDESPIYASDYVFIDGKSVTAFSKGGV